MQDKSNQLRYTSNLLGRNRFKTRKVQIGNLTMGGDSPIRVQSMTTTDTMDTKLSVEQSIRMIDAGCELVRLTAPSKKEAENLRLIKEELVARGYHTPLVADIHFTPNAAEIAAQIIEKVRVNPGNYADKKKFEEIEYTDESYAAELERIEKKFTPLVLLCKEHGTAMRIGTNHGSLSDRILSRFGDTPEGMAESAMEFIRICRKNDFHELVISMKASNTLVMVQAYRLLVATMTNEGMDYPLHLGVTEAGDGEDGRIKSAVGIGALLEDGLGDTIRVSLTEEPEHEIPVAQKLVSLYENTAFSVGTYEGVTLPYSPYHYQRHQTESFHNIGGKNVPIVFTDFSNRESISPANLFGVGYHYSKELDKWNIQDQAADYLYLGDKTIDFEVPGTLGIVVNGTHWLTHYQEKQGYFPLFEASSNQQINSEQLVFIEINLEQPFVGGSIMNHPKKVLVLHTKGPQSTQYYRNFLFNFANMVCDSPIVLKYKCEQNEEDAIQLEASAKMGVMLIDGFGDGIWINGSASPNLINTTSFGILQATRTRISKTEYISCPSCGRTLFDLQETTAKIREKTSHLKGVKIGIMGCIVNGPGEMADADYGYVGTGPGKITLYKEKTVVEKNVAEDEAVDALIGLIKQHGDWVEPKN
jgi:(E)-4-hydroxy-3-methylbut-2-enyl-diphosphate synthase